jgi:hypothetical protein
LLNLFRTLLPHDGWSGDSAKGMEWLYRPRKQMDAFIAKMKIQSFLQPQV